MAGAAPPTKKGSTFQVLPSICLWPDGLAQLGCHFGQDRCQSRFSALCLQSFCQRIKLTGQTRIRRLIGKLFVCAITVSYTHLTLPTIYSV